MPARSRICELIRMALTNISPMHYIDSYQYFHLIFFVHFIKTIHKYSNIQILVLLKPVCKILDL